MTIHQNNVKDLSAKTGKLYLVDLAGSEKISKTGATGLTLEEAKTINKSLTTLGMVINSLTDGKSSHIPYRESKLTRVLQESLGGNSKTCLIITCSPSVYNDSETLSTLRFGLRAKKIKNKPKINKEITLSELKMEIERLELLFNSSNKRVLQLERFIKNNGLTIPLPEEEIEESKFIKEEKIAYLNDPSTDIIKKQIIYVKTDNDTKENRITMGLGLMSEQLKYERDINKIQQKNFSEVGEENKTLKDKLEYILGSLNEHMNDGIAKDELIISLNDLKIKYCLEETELLSKIQNLEKTLEEINSNRDKLKVESEEDNRLDNDVNKSRQTIFQNEEEDIILDESSDPLEKTNDREIREPLERDNGSLSIFNEILEKFQNLAQNNPDLKNILIQYNDNLNNFKDRLFWSDKKEYNKDELNDEEKNRNENEKKIIMKALEEKSERLGQCEIENKDLNDSLKNFVSKINSEDKPNIKKIIILEKNLEHLNKMFQHSMAEKSILTLDKEVLLYYYIVT